MEVGHAGGSEVREGEMAAPLLLLLLLAALSPSHGGLLGAGEGLGSCAAYPFRAHSVHWVGGCPPHAPCCSEFGFCRPRVSKICWNSNTCEFRLNGIMGTSETATV